jgi:hypothetical protein
LGNWYSSSDTEVFGHAEINGKSQLDRIAIG